MPAYPASRQAENAESQNRTGDTMIFSHVLYQLSYLGLNVLLSWVKPLCIMKSLSQSPTILPICYALVKRKNQGRRGLMDV